MAGRWVFGFAIDRLPAHTVAAVGFGLPIIGLLILLSPFDSLPAVMFAMVLIGAAFGSEADVIPFLVSQRFGIARFGTVLALHR